MKSSLRILTNAVVLVFFCTGCMIIRTTRTTQRGDARLTANTYHGCPPGFWTGPPRWPGFDSSLPRFSIGAATQQVFHVKALPPEFFPNQLSVVAPVAEFRWFENHRGDAKTVEHFPWAGARIQLVIEDANQTSLVNRTIEFGRVAWLPQETISECSLRHHLADLSALAGHSNLTVKIIVLTPSTRTSDTLQLVGKDLGGIGSVRPMKFYEEKTQTPK